MKFTTLHQLHRCPALATKSTRSPVVMLPGGASGRPILAADPPSKGNGCIERTQAAK